MMRRFHAMRRFGPALCALLLACGACLAHAAPSPIVGRWDVTVKTGRGGYPSWFEITEKAGALTGRFVGQGGSARPIQTISFEGGRLRFSLPPQFENRQTDLVFEGRLENGTLAGTTTSDQGETREWTARRAPDLKRAGAVVWDEPIPLFNGKNLDGWRPRYRRAQNGWSVRDGVLANQPPSTDLVTERTFTDFKLHAEFRYPRGSNSGIYLRGRYELQIEDNFGQEPESHQIGGVYGFLTPVVNAARRPNEWQTLDATLVGRTVTLVFNGKTVLDRQQIPGITGGALDSDEAAPGPLMVQGDHGPIEFRALTLTPARTTAGAAPARKDGGNK